MNYYGESFHIKKDRKKKFQEQREKMSLPSIGEIFNHIIPCEILRLVLFLVLNFSFR